MPTAPASTPAVAHGALRLEGRQASRNFSNAEQYSEYQHMSAVTLASGWSGLMTMRGRGERQLSDPKVKAQISAMGAAIRTAGGTVAVLGQVDSALRSSEWLSARNRALPYVVEPTPAPGDWDFSFGTEDCKQLGQELIGMDPSLKPEVDKAIAARDSSTLRRVMLEYAAQQVDRNQR